VTLFDLLLSATLLIVILASFKVISDNCTLGNQGSTVTEAELEDVNFEALLEGGHLEVVSSKTQKNTNTEGE